MVRKFKIEIDLIDMMSVVVVGMLIVAVVFCFISGGACKWCTKQLNSWRRRQKISEKALAIEDSTLCIKKLQVQEKNCAKSPRQREKYRQIRQNYVELRNLDIEEKANLEKHHPGDDDGQLSSPPALDDPIRESGFASRAVREST